MRTRDVDIEPVTAAAKELRSNVTAKRWLRMVKEAKRQAQLVMKVRAQCAASGLSLFQGLRAVSPTTSWPSFQYWCKRAGDAVDVSWELLLDHRVPPKQEPVPDVVRACAVTIRRMRPDIGYREAHDELVAQHGALGDISPSSLSRIWKAAGLYKEKAKEPLVTEFHGGAGLALIGAASLETGSSTALADAIVDGARQTVARQLAGPVPTEPAGRDEKGRLTAEYNRSTRLDIESGKSDARWEPDYVKRQKRELAQQRVLQERPATLAQKALAIGAMPLITERRGFDGLDGPQGEWLALLSDGVAYKPSTLDKFLSQLGMLDVEDELWAAHASISLSHIDRWAVTAGGPPWLAIVLYIDATQDPYWTRKYALSGKISRTGRVGPCLSRVSVNAGPGIPFLMESYPGGVSLKTELPRILDRVKDLVGDDGVRRLTIIDAEMSTTKLLAALVANSDIECVTVLKGRSFNSFESQGEWQEYRERDQVREGSLVIYGNGASEEGLRLRVVEMRRQGRHDQSTFFATTYIVEHLSTTAVVDAYLSRWPNQEHMFRNTRNGLGLNRSHGFSGENIHHLALGTKKEKAHSQLERAQRQQAEEQRAVDAAQKIVQRASETNKASRNQLAKSAQAQLNAARKAVSAAEKVCAKLATTSPVIYERDTARENVVTAFTLNVLFLIEFVLREYFGGIRMELRTFIEYFVNQPLTVTTTDTELTYRIQANPRNKERTDQMRKACDEVTRRRLTRGNRRLVFLVIDRERKRGKD
jgi:hypothetical protein